MSHFRGLRAQRMTSPRNGAELELGPWPMPGDTEQPEQESVLVPEPVELHTLGGQHDTGWSGPGGCFPGYPTTKHRSEG